MASERAPLVALVDAELVEGGSCGEEGLDRRLEQLLAANLAAVAALIVWAIVRVVRARRKSRADAARKAPASVDDTRD